MKGLFVILFVCVAGSMVHEAYAHGPHVSSDYNGTQLDVEDYLVEDEAELEAPAESGRQKRAVCVKDWHHKSCLYAAARGECTKDGIKTVTFMRQNCCESCAALEVTGVIGFFTVFPPARK